VIQQSQALVLREQQSQALMSPAHMSAAQEKAAMFAAQMNAKAQAAKQAAAEEHFQVCPRRLLFRFSEGLQADVGETAETRLLTRLLLDLVVFRRSWRSTISRSTHAGR
jgi:hypothetical protein